METTGTRAVGPQLWERRRTLIAWSLALPFVAWALFRLLGLDRGFPLVPITAFTPYVALASLFAIAGVGLLRVRGALLAAAAATAVLALVVLPRAVPGGQVSEPDGGAELTVMTANLHFGEADPAAVVSLAREAGVDLLAVQELTPKAARRLRAAGLERLLGHTVLPAEPGAGGGGLYARTSLTGTGNVGRPEGFRMPSAVLATAETTLTVVSVHPVPPTDAESVRRWRDALRALPVAGTGGELSLLLGDFNATLDHSELQRVLDRGYVDAADVAGAGLSATWSRGPWPPLTIDHVLVDDRIYVDGTEVRELPGSDHQVVVVDLVLPRT